MPTPLAGLQQLSPCSNLPNLPSNSHNKDKRRRRQQQQQQDSNNPAPAFQSQAEAVVGPDADEAPTKPDPGVAGKASVVAAASADVGALKAEA